MRESFLNQEFEEKNPKELEVEEKSQNKSILLAVFDFIKTTIVVVFLAFVIRLFVIQPFIVEGQSMLPLFANNDYLITEKISYELRSPKRGEIVIFHPPDNPSINYIKRIIGLPGDKIEIKEGEVYVNNQKINEKYLAQNEPTKALTQDLVVQLKDNEFFVLGDNRNHSRDSREIGPIPRNNIVARVWLRLFPLNNISAFAAVNYNLSD